MSSYYGSASSHASGSGSGSHQAQQPTKPSPQQIREAAEAIKYSLRGQVYALIGGAACSMLGSSRETEDVDIVVPQDATKYTRSLLRNQPMYFKVESNTAYTYYKSDPRVEIEILAPPGMFKERFDNNTAVVEVNGVRILKPSLILNAKCKSILGRAYKAKKNTDADDIIFILKWCASNNQFPTAAEVPNATKEFVEFFIHEYKEADSWTNARYNWKTG